MCSGHAPVCGLTVDVVRGGWGIWGEAALLNAIISLRETDVRDSEFVTNKYIEGIHDGCEDVLVCTYLVGAPPLSDPKPKFGDLLSSGSSLGMESIGNT